MSEYRFHYLLVPIKLLLLSFLMAWLVLGVRSIVSHTLGAVIGWKIIRHSVQLVLCGGACH